MQFERGDMALSVVVPVLGPPASGKTTLTLALVDEPYRQVFRLREHVPTDVLAATVTTTNRLGWIADNVVEPTVRRYFRTATDDARTQAVLLDNFPGTGEQVTMLINTLADIAPSCVIEPVELVLDESSRRSRARKRRVCHRCEKDPIADPRLPAVASASNAWRCANCGNLLHPRRGDAPSLFMARTRRHEHSVDAVRAAFLEAGHAVTTLDATADPAVMASLLAPLLIIRSQTT